MSGWLRPQPAGEVVKPRPDWAVRWRCTALNPRLDFDATIGHFNLAGLFVVKTRFQARTFLTASSALLFVMLAGEGLADNEQQASVAADSSEIALGNEIRLLALNWMQAWTDLDANKMAELHDSELAYFWRGKPDSSEDFLDAFENFVVPNAPEEPVIYEVLNLNVQVLGSDVAIAAFNFHEKLQDEDSGAAVSLVFVRRDDGWKIIHAHESKIRR